jgi:hypothetical protein
LTRASMMKRGKGNLTDDRMATHHGLPGQARQ